jgi:gas vesicle protein
MSREDVCNGHSVILSFFLGAVAGAAAVLYLAPQTRRESAERLRDFSSDIKERASDYIEQGKEKVSGVTARSREFLDEKRSLIQSAVEAGKDAYNREKSKGTAEA